MFIYQYTEVNAKHVNLELK